MALDYRSSLTMQRKGSHMPAVPDSAPGVLSSCTESRPGEPVHKVRGGCVPVHING